MTDLRPRASFHRALLLAASTLALGACFDPPAQYNCSTDADCGGNFYCVKRQCVRGPNRGDSGTGGGSSGGSGGGVSTGGGSGGSGGGVSTGGGSGGSGGGVSTGGGSGGSGGGVSNGGGSGGSGGGVSNGGGSGGSGGGVSTGGGSGGSGGGTPGADAGCVGGCIDGILGNCVVNGGSFFCGADGGSCKSCGTGQMCSAGSCVTGTSTCGPASCNGCCVLNFCIPLAVEQNNLCGMNGGTCSACTAGKTCTNGACVTPIVQDAGTPASTWDGGATNYGKACTATTDCMSPSDLCTLSSAPVIGNTGYVGGYCSKNCTSGASCGDTGLCVSETFLVVTLSSCKQPCAAPDAGQGSCRTGYVCKYLPTGGSTGWCAPRCDNGGPACPSGTTCRVTGYCQ